MQRSSSTANNGGYFKASSIFGRSKTPTTSTYPPRTPTKEIQPEKQSRPSTSSTPGHSESTQSPPASGSTFSESRNTSFSSSASASNKSPPKLAQRTRSSSFGQSNIDRERKVETKEPVKTGSLRRKNSRTFTNPFGSAVIGDAVRLAPRRKNSTTDTVKSPKARDKESAKPPSAHQNLKRAEIPLVSAHVGDAGQIATTNNKETTTSNKDPAVNNRESVSSIAPFVEMLARPGTSYSTAPPSNGVGSFNATLLPQSPTLETITYQHIQETSSKRISTLDYLRKA